MCEAMVLSRGDPWPLPSWRLLCSSLGALPGREPPALPPRELLREPGGSPLASRASPPHCYSGSAGWSAIFLSYPQASSPWSQVRGHVQPSTPLKSQEESACSPTLPPGRATGGGPASSAAPWNYQRQPKAKAGSCHASQGPFSAFSSHVTVALCLALALLIFCPRCHCAQASLSPSVFGCVYLKVT